MEELPPPLPHTPRFVDPVLWRDALEAVACFSSRYARALDSHAYLPDLTERGQALTERHAARWRLVLIGEFDPVPWFFSEEVPELKTDTEADVALNAVGVFSAMAASSSTDSEAVDEMFQRAIARHAASTA
jgi:hypothetical protein